MSTPFLQMFLYERFKDYGRAEVNITIEIYTWPASHSFFYKDALRLGHIAFASVIEAL